MTKPATKPTTKSEHVRALIKKKRAASPKKLHAELKKAGVNVSLALVSKIKCAGRRKKRAKLDLNAGHKPAATNGHADLSHLMAAKTFVAAVGGIKAAQIAIKQFDKLST